MKTIVTDRELRDYHESNTGGRGLPSRQFVRHGNKVISTSFKYYVGGISTWFETTITFDFARIKPAEALMLYYLPALREDYFERVVSEYHGQEFKGFGSSGEQAAAYHTFDTAIFEIFTWKHTTDGDMFMGGHNKRHVVAKVLIQFFAGKRR